MEDVDIPYHQPSPPWSLFWFGFVFFCFSAGLTHQTSATIDVLVGLDVILQCLLPTSTTGEVKWFNITQNNGGKQNESEMEEHSAQLLFHNLNKAHTGTYACRTKSTGTTFRNRHSGQNPGKTNKPTSPQRSREEGPRKKKQRLKRGTTLLRWEATAAQKFRNNSEVPQGEHEGIGWGLLCFLCFSRADHFPTAHLPVPPHAP